MASHYRIIKSPCEQAVLPKGRVYAWLQDKELLTLLSAGLHTHTSPISVPAGQIIGTTTVDHLISIAGQSLLSLDVTSSSTLPKAPVGQWTERQA